MADMQKAVDAVSEALPTLSPQMRRAAMVVLDDPNSVAVDSMRTLAGRAEVSPPTMLRLAKRVGFSSYEAFREVFKKNVARYGYGDRAADLRRSVGEDGISGLVAGTAAAALAGIERFRDPVLWRAVDRVADLIVGARTTYVVGSGASFGQAVSFHYVCRMALPTIQLANELGTRAVDGLATAGPDDLVLAISTSPYARQTVEAAVFAEARGVPVAAITDRRSGPIAMVAAAVAIVDTTGSHYFPSMIALSAVLEALSAAVAVKRGPDGVAAISGYEEALKESGYYWEAEGGR